MEKLRVISLNQHQQLHVLRLEVNEALKDIDSFGFNMKNQKRVDQDSKIYNVQQAFEQGNQTFAMADYLSQFDLSNPNLKKDQQQYICDNLGLNSGNNVIVVSKTHESLNAIGNAFLLNGVRKDEILCFNVNDEAITYLHIGMKVRFTESMPPLVANRQPGTIVGFVYCYFGGHQDGCQGELC